MPLYIRPFSAIYYNSEIIGDYAKVICPPYDIISPKDLQKFRRMSPYNFSHIIIPENKDYKRVAKKITLWRRKKILIDDAPKGIYLYSQRFSFQNHLYQRVGIFSLLKMDKKNIFPHENTFSAPKQDRRKILEATLANLTAVFTVIPKRKPLFSKLYNDFSNLKPFIHCFDFEGNENILWKITDKTLIKFIARQLKDEKLIIADGHHRYEVCYDFYLSNKDRFKDASYILAYITDTSSLLILPTHRIVFVDAAWNKMLSKIKDIFPITKVAKECFMSALSKKNFVLGIYRNGNYAIVNLPLDTLRKKRYNFNKFSDVDILHKIILPCFKIRGSIAYTHTFEEAKKVAGRNKTVFVLKPLSASSIFNFTRRGEKLPEKTTYFYPKIVSGLIMRKFIPINKNEDF